MIRFAFCSSLLFLASTASTESASQSDWSGGPGTPGPVLTWGDDFSIDTGCAWSETPGSICLVAGVEHLIDGSFDGGFCVTSRDIDGDGAVDALGAAYFGDEVVWWKNVDGSGTIWSEYVISPLFDHAASVHSDDIDGDGDIDVLGAAAGSNFIDWWENNDGSGTSWTEHIVDGDFTGAISVHSADVDGDGDADILGAANVKDDITWWENLNGSGTAWVQHTIDGEMNLARSVFADDVDGDGDIDVIGAGGDVVAWWENSDGQGGAWTEHVIDGYFDIGRTVRTDDIDGDGDVDVLAAGWDEFAIAWWENTDGLGEEWIEHTVEPDIVGAESVDSADLDGDGDVDIAGSSTVMDIVSWWENTDGAGSAWIEHPIANGFTHARCIHADDLNSDGEVDLLGAADGIDDVRWWDLDAHPFNGSMESSILYTGCDPDWGSLLWSSTTPPGTSVSLQVRASDDFRQMGAWSDTLAVPCSLQGILADTASFIQYRAILSTADPDTTPTLLDLTVTWNPLGTGECEDPTTIELQPFSPNPTSGPITVSFGLPSAMVAGFSVFDVSGRVVAQEPAAEYPAGYQQIQLGELPPGIYICRMRAGGFSATQRFAVVE